MTLTLRNPPSGQPITAADVAALLGGSSATYSFVEDFDSTPNATITTTGQYIGCNTGWFARAFSSGASGSIANVSGTSVQENHPGVLRVLTGATGNSSATLSGLYLQKAQQISSTSQYMRLEALGTFGAVLNVPTVTSVRVWVGLATAVNSPTFGNDCALFLADTGETPTVLTWQAVVRGAAGEVRFDTLIPVVAQQWYDLEIEQVTRHVFLFRINGVLAATLERPNQSGNLGAVNLGALVAPLSNSLRELQLDLASLVSKPLNRLLAA